MKYLIQNKWWEIDKDYNIDKMLYLLIDRPDVINSLNVFIWKNSRNQKHRNCDLPATVCNKTISWYYKGKNYRNNNKPIIIWYNGIKEYWLDSRQTK